MIVTSLAKIFPLIDERKPTFEELVERLERRPLHKIGKKAIATYRDRIEDLEKRGLIKYLDGDPPRLTLTEEGRLYNI